MTRRATPLVDHFGALPANAVPQVIVDDAMVGIGFAEPHPPQSPTGEPLVIWVRADACDGEPPPGTTSCTLDDAIAWTSDGPPPWLRRRQLDGILVQYAADAPSDVRRAARALRERLTPRDVAGLRELALRWGNPTIIDALARIGAQRTPTFADLARALSRSDDPDAAHYARLCWALEHL